MSINTTSMFCLYKKGQERTPKRTLSRELPPERVQARFSRVLHVVCACCAACIAILTLRSTSSMCLHLACCCTGLIHHCDQIDTSLNVHFGPSSAGADTGPPVLWIGRQAPGSQIKQRILALSLFISYFGPLVDLRFFITLLDSFLFFSFVPSREASSSRDCGFSERGLGMSWLGLGASCFADSTQVLWVLWPVLFTYSAPDQW